MYGTCKTFPTCVLQEIILNKRHPPVVHSVLFTYSHPLIMCICETPNILSASEMQLQKLRRVRLRYQLLGADSVLSSREPMFSRPN